MKDLHEGHPNCFQYDPEDYEVTLTATDIRACFDPVIDSILGLIKRQKAAVVSENAPPITDLILVGGFGSTPYVWKEVKEFCGGLILLIWPDKPWSAIARGAALRGLGGGIVTKRRCRRHYGFSLGLPFRPGIDLQDKYFCIDPFNGKEMRGGWMIWNINKGMSLHPGERKTIPFCKTHRKGDATEYSLSLYSSSQETPPRRKDEPGDYDCFYAAVFEAENPALKSLPLAVQQKQIIVTCNYEARRRGLYKLQLVREAKKACPDLIIVLGEDLTRFRNASKALYKFLQQSIWSQKAERLGFDEVFLDVTDMIDYNAELVNHNNPEHSYFHLDRNDPLIGFHYDASVLFGNSFPSSSSSNLLSSPWPLADGELNTLLLRLRLGSHLATHLRHHLENEHSYTATVGISTNKLLSKLVGNANKPKNQTTLIPPYTSRKPGEESNVTKFLDSHDIGRIPGIGFKMSHKIRTHVLRREPDFDVGLVYGGTKENITVRDVRLFPGIGANLLENWLGGPGSPRDIGAKVWGLINGLDDTEVSKARSVPRQISIEDSYIRLDTLEEVKKELRLLAASLLRRMRTDLTEADDEDEFSADDESSRPIESGKPKRYWLAHPRTLRLSTRARPPRNMDGTRARSFHRVSRSCPMPNFVFSLNESIGVIVEKLVSEVILPTFRKLHPEPSGWDLSLVNVAATNMMEAATGGKDGNGRDIGKMFRKQNQVLKEWKIEDRDVPPSDNENENNGDHTSKSLSPDSPIHKAYTVQEDHHESEGQAEGEKVKDEEETWEDDDGSANPGETCRTCGAVMPAFAMEAHERFHLDPD
ncbi:MAG: hypothetical protein MMC33_002201 [Icmadophila ericetorum]|nr:hypothetical protein [Icmadophila ericetorum]